MDFDRAQQEVENLYGHSVEIAKKIKFDAGKLETSWVKNCAAVGLSSSFIEPLEASSIGCSIQQAFLLCDLLVAYRPDSKYTENHFNRRCDELLTNILDFVALHYVTKRNDTDFWKSVKELPKPDSLQEKLESFKYRMPIKADFMNRNLMFKESNWIMVMHGLDLIPRELAQVELDFQPDHMIETMKMNIDNILGKNDMRPEDFVSHRAALQWLIDNPEQM
jgi:tryptophan halogenase